MFDPVSAFMILAFSLSAGIAIGKDKCKSAKEFSSMALKKGFALLLAFGLLVSFGAPVMASPMAYSTKQMTTTDVDSLRDVTGSAIKMPSGALLLIAPTQAFAQDAPADPTLPPPPTDQEWGQWIAKLLALEGASGFAIAIVILNLLMLAFRGPLGERAGKWRLTAVLVISFLIAAINAYVNGGGFAGLMKDGAVLASLSVMANQLIKQYFTSTGDKV